jgi:hypothetical protein
MKIIRHLLLIIPIGVVFLLSACSKKCDISMTDTNNGDIVPNANIFPINGYLTGNMGNDFVIHGNDLYAQSMEVSLDGGARGPIDYSQYCVMCYPVNATCNASYDRTVTIDDVNQTVNYKIVVTQCKEKECGLDVFTENYVLVTDFPETYNVTYDVSYVEK